MEDIVLANRLLTPKDLELWSLIVQLTSDELDESICLVRDLIADRGRSVVVASANVGEPVRHLQVSD